jgi:hypothetical protein
VTHNSVIALLQQFKDPCLQLKLQNYLLRDEKEKVRLETEVRSSLRVESLLRARLKAGGTPLHPYSKWRGAHWVLADLADLGYPPGDDRLIPLRDRVYNWLFGKTHESSIVTISDRVRRCASQEGNALFVSLKLGLQEARTEELAQRLVKWQWPDGGWNCDKKPHASHSSFNETLIPFRALSLFAKQSGERMAMDTVQQAAEVFLSRNIFRRLHDGTVIRSEFKRIAYPAYWHFDILFCLKVLAEAGMISDPRCEEALDVLESKRLDDGGFPAEKKYYRVTEKPGSGVSAVDWGGTSKRRMNPWVTVDALYVLQEAGRLL